MSALVFDDRRGVPSASALERLEACPASWVLGQEAERQGMVPPAEEAAESGTRIHKWLENRYDSDWDVLTPDEQETAQRCFDAACRIIDEWGCFVADGFLFHYEYRLGLTVLGNVMLVRPETSDVPFVFTGMADMIVVDLANKRGLVLDYKTGRGDVMEAKGNRQLMGLAVLVREAWFLREVRVAIIQPWAGPPSVADYNGNALAAATKWLEATVEKATHPKYSLRPSEERVLDDFATGDWCRYCPARAICPALRQVATSAPDSLGIATVTGKGDHARATLTARAMDLPADALAGLLRGRRMIDWYLGAIEAAAKMRLERGESIPGYELRERNGKREIIDPEKAAAVVAPLLSGAVGGSAAALLRACTLRPAVLEDEIRMASGPKLKKDGTPSKVGFAMTAKEAAELMAGALGENLTRRTSMVLCEVGAVLDDENAEPSDRHE